MGFQNTNKGFMRVKLIFNPNSGAKSKSPIQLANVIKEMQNWKLTAEPIILEPDCDLNMVVNEAISKEIRMFVVCGGDGTVSAVTKAMIGTKATLGIIPTGTQNNVALSLGIPTDISEAIAILREGKRIKTDMGIITCNNIVTPFIEVCTVGLLSTLFPSGDEIQHGNISQVGDFLATLTTSAPSEIHLLMDDKRDIERSGHAVIISNMPYVGRHHHVGSIESFSDGLLDVSIFDNLSKLGFVGYIIKGDGAKAQEDSRIQQFHARKVIIDTRPAMSVMADGIILGEGQVQIEIRHHALNIMVKPEVIDVLNEVGEVHEE